MQAGVDFQVHRNPAALGGQGPGVFGADHRLGQAVPGQQGNLPGAGAAQHQDGAPHAAPPQAHPLGGGGYGEGADALPGADAGHRQIPVAVGVGLHHRHELPTLRQQGGEGGQVVPQGGGVHLNPRPPPGVGLGGTMECEGEGQQGGQEHHGPVVAQAVVHQQSREAHHPCPAPHQHDAPGVEHVDGRRPPPEGGGGGQLQGGQPQEQKPYAQGKGEVEGVEPGQGEVLDQQALRRQQDQGERQANPIEARPVPPGPLGQPATQQQEDGGGE